MPKPGITSGPIFFSLQGFLGLMCVLGGIGTLGYQLIASATYDGDVHDGLHFCCSADSAGGCRHATIDISSRRFPMCSPLGCAA